VAAWLRRGELKAGRIICKPFDDKALKSALPTIRAMTTLDPSAFMNRLRNLLADCGVAFVMTAELPGTHLAGATRWLGPNKVMVQLSLRHKTDDHFWFALFHELGHVLAGKRSHLDESGRAEVALPSADEVQADRFATALLGLEGQVEDLDVSHLSAEGIRAIADKVGVAPGLVVGYLEHWRKLAPARFRHLKRSWTLAEA
jgi:hypothetical protein